jgi:hypothetical protein
MDKVVDGSEEDIKAWLAEQRERVSVQAPSPREPAVTSHEIARETDVNFKSETQVDLEQQYEQDRMDANQMMREHYQDIMADPELVGLAQQRFNAIKNNPTNEGRSQRDLARESAEYVRSIRYRLEGKVKRPTPAAEQERQTRIERKRKLPQPSRADAAAPSGEPVDNPIPSRKEHLMRLRRRAGLETPTG